MCDRAEWDLSVSRKAGIFRARLLCKEPYIVAQKSTDLQNW